MATEVPQLRRVLGPLEVTASGVGIIIGAGIYVLLGTATARAGGGVWMSFGLAAVLCALTGLSYAELGSMFPRAGAEYEYTRHVFPESVAFLVGWTMAAGLVVAAAAIAIGFAHYVQYFVDIPVQAAALPLLGVELLVALGGIARSARLTVVLSTLQAAALVAIVAIGAPHVRPAHLVSGATPGGVVAGAALVFFAFIGFDEVTTLAEETVNPTRVIPRALLSALAISAALYMAVAIAAVSVIGPNALGTSSRPLADVVAHVLGGRAETAVAVIALLTTVNTSLLALTAGSRVLYGMASHGALPPFVARVSSRTGAPVGAIALIGVFAIAFAAIGDLTLIASVTDFAVYVVFVAVNATVVLLRRNAPDTPRPFRVAGTIGWVPVIPIVATAAVFVMVPQLSLDSLLLGVGLIAAGAVVVRLEPPCAT
ncbi:MAG TPA: APC family permease [Acidimicrobiales bacterium]|nr:APC family permease [Acidimicrobiales bacterium]